MMFILICPRRKRKEPRRKQRDIHSHIMGLVSMDITITIIQRERVVVKVEERVEERVEEESNTRVGYYGALWGLETLKWVKNIKENLRDVELV
jgi:hypothetical protein